ncbi:tautomerase family protein [Arthrobacter sp. FW306-04-A]|nr:tautomerase family protein [Arthrobacter sp. FW306-04-A]
MRPRSGRASAALLSCLRHRHQTPGRGPYRYVRLVSYEPHRMVNGLDAGQQDYYTRVTIDCFSGRSLEAKRNPYREIVERLKAVGIPRDGVSILLRENPPENWGLNGGQAASDYDLGFDINV